MGPKVTNGDPDEPKTAGDDGHDKVECQVQEAVSAAVAVVSVGVSGHDGFLSGWVANKKTKAMNIIIERQVRCLLLTIRLVILAR